MTLADITTEEIAGYGRILKHLSEARDDTSLRTGILEDMRVVFRCDTVTTCRWNDDTAQFDQMHFVGSDPVLHGLYASDYQFDDPITFRLRARARAAIVDEVIDREELRASSYYNEMLSLDALEWGMNLFAFGDDQRDLGDLRLWRRRQRDNFAERDKMLLDSLAPYFRQALIRVGSASRPVLSAREHDVTNLLCRGLTDQDIARVLDIGFATVRTHVGNAMKKFGAANRAELAALFTRSMS